MTRPGAPVSARPVPRGRRRSARPRSSCPVSPTPSTTSPRGVHERPCAAARRGPRRRHERRPVPTPRLPRGLLTVADGATTSGRGPVWHLVTGEYPPRPGGVGDYSALLAAGLAAAGGEVHVWTASAG